MAPESTVEEEATTSGLGGNFSFLSLLQAVAGLAETGERTVKEVERWIN